MSPARLSAERAILTKYFPKLSMHTSGELVAGPLTANSGREYQIRVNVPPAFPDVCPPVYITAPVLYTHSGQKLTHLGALGAMHTLGPMGDWVQVCHSHPNHWVSAGTLYKVVLKARLWLEAYEAHLLDGRNLDTWLRHA